MSSTASLASPRGQAAATLGTPQPAAEPVAKAAEDFKTTSL